MNDSMIYKIILRLNLEIRLVRKSILLANVLAKMRNLKLFLNSYNFSQKYE